MWTNHWEPNEIVTKAKNNFGFEKLVHTYEGIPLERYEHHFAPLYGVVKGGSLGSPLFFLRHKKRGPKPLLVFNEQSNYWEMVL